MKEYELVRHYCIKNKIKFYTDQAADKRNYIKYNKRNIKKLIRDENPSLIYVTSANTGFRRWLSMNYRCCMLSVMSHDKGKKEYSDIHKDNRPKKYKSINDFLGNSIYIDGKLISYAYPVTLKGLYYYIKDYLIWGVRKPFTISAAGNVEIAIVNGPKYKKLIQEESPNVKEFKICRNIAIDLYKKKNIELEPVKETKQMIVIATSAIETRRNKNVSSKYYGLLDTLLIILENNSASYVIKFHPNTSNEIIRKYTNKNYISNKLKIDDEITLAKKTKLLITNGPTNFDIAFKMNNVEIVSIDYDFDNEEVLKKVKSCLK